MNRNQRIVVSIVGIIIVTLALIGITYAYFMTKIIGNSNSKSISGTLANLELTYYDGNGVIAPDNLMMPGDTLEKTFSVKNTGTVKIENYAVIFENLTNTLTRKEDLVYTLTCSSDDNNPCIGVEDVQFPDDNGPIIYNSINKGVTHSYTLTVTYKNLEDTNQSDDMGASFSAKVNITDGKNASLPIKTMILLNSNTTRNGTTYRETPLTKPAIETTTSEQIIDKGFGPFTIPMSGDSKIVAVENYEIDQESNYVLNSTNKTTYQNIYESLTGKYLIFDPYGDYGNYGNTTTTEVFGVINATKDKVTLERHRIVLKSKESTLSKVEDVYGTSYYYRGAIEDNYLTFNNMCWRIVRIQGDGSTKIILQDPTAPCDSDTNEEYPFIGAGSFGYDGTSRYAGSEDYLNCSSDSGTCMKKKFDLWFNSNFISVKDKLKEETWYLGDTNNTYHYNPYSYGSGYDYYETGQRLRGYGTTRGMSLLSTTNEFTSYIGAITADEVALAGATIDKYNSDYYLFVPEANYWTLSLDLRGSNSDFAFEVRERLENLFVGHDNNHLRPVLVLGSDVKVTGQGTKADPYIVQ